MDEAATIQRDRRFAQTVLRISPFILATMICGYVLSQQSLRWPGLWLIMLALISPLLITSRPRKRLWLVPLLLVLIALAFGWQSVKLRGALPPGRWTTPMTSASCSSTVQLDLNREHAWCANESTGQIFQFTPGTGLVGQKFVVEYGAQAFAGNANQVWIMQNPASGLIMADKNQQTRIRVNFPIQGTVDPEGRLWVIDVVGILWVNEPGEDWKWLKSSDGLLDNTANVVKTSPDGSVWIGSYHGVSILLPGKSTWQYVTRSDGLPGEVLDLAFAPDGAVWYLWEALSAYQDRSQWGVSSEQGYHWRHIGLGEKTGLDLPISQHALAVDGQGRIWFVAPSYKESTNYLGILVSHNGIVSLYPLGPFDLTPGGILTAGFQGVIDDGGGGIFVYDPVFAPLRHWRPDQKYHEYNPCPQPCMNA
jgi:streptogramin lyase